MNRNDGPLEGDAWTRFGCHLDWGTVRGAGRRERGESRGERGREVDVKNVEKEDLLHSNKVGVEDR